MFFQFGMEQAHIVFVYLYTVAHHLSTIMEQTEVLNLSASDTLLGSKRLKCKKALSRRKDTLADNPVIIGGCTEVAARHFCLPPASPSIYVSVPTTVRS